LVGDPDRGRVRWQEKFTQRYELSEARVTATLRDLPPVAGKILWARQIERQLRLLMQRMEDVLGQGWEKHVDGKQLKGVCDELLRNLDTDSFFRWAYVRVPRVGKAGSFPPH
jgi:dynein heavy chain 1, cytosolic